MSKMYAGTNLSTSSKSITLAEIKGWLERHDPAWTLEIDPKVARNYCATLVGMVEGLQAVIDEVKAELACIPHTDCATKVGKPCDCGLEDVWAALNKEQK